MTQDQPKELLAYFESQRPVFRKRAEEFEQEELAAAIPRQLDALIEFAARAYRRPLDETRKNPICSACITSSATRRAWPTKKHFVAC